MKVIVGLGNPGTEYLMTRHNAGQLFVDRMFKVQVSRFKDTYGWRRNKDVMVAEFSEMILVKSANIFMNESGRMVSNAPLHPPLNIRGGNLRSFDDMFIAHDDLDIKLGEYKIQYGKGPKEHGGINSIEGVLGTKEFWRIRIGIDNRKILNSKSQDPNNIQTINSNNQNISGEEYVLQKFSLEEKGILDGVIEKIVSEFCA